MSVLTPAHKQAEPAFVSSALLRTAKRQQTTAIQYFAGIVGFSARLVSTPTVRYGLVLSKVLKKKTLCNIFECFVQLLKKYNRRLTIMRSLFYEQRFLKERYLIQESTYDKYTAGSPVNSRRKIQESTAALVQPTTATLLTSH